VSLANILHNRVEIVYLVLVNFFVNIVLVANMTVSTGNVIPSRKRGK
jgi:hypothetical protein